MPRSEAARAPAMPSADPPRRTPSERAPGHSPLRSATARASSLTWPTIAAPVQMPRGEADDRVVCLDHAGEGHHPGFRSRDDDRRGGDRPGLLLARDLLDQHAAACRGEAEPIRQRLLCEGRVAGDRVPARRAAAPSASAGRSSRQRACLCPDARGRAWRRRRRRAPTRSAPATGRRVPMPIASARGVIAPAPAG